jgi:hypothetical protein
VEQFLPPSIQQLATQALVFSFRHGLLPYRILAGAASLLLLLLSLFPRDRKQTDAGTPAGFGRGDLLYLLALLLFLVALRWPSLALGDLEGDESVAVSAALTRYLDPAYGLTLFTGSAGPLLTYPVAAVGLLGFRIDYGASKLVSLILIIASSAILYLALRTFSPPRTARVAMLPLLLILGLGNIRWTLSYCSEQWINLLVITGIYFLLRLEREIGREVPNLCGIGLALGSIPLVKWQGVPMGALVAACAIAVLVRRHLPERAGRDRLARGLLLLAGLGGLPLLTWCGVLWISGDLDFFVRTYFLALFNQATSRYSSTLLERLLALPSWGFPAYSVERWTLLFTGIVAVPVAIELFRAGRPPGVRRDLTLAVLYLVLSVYAVLQPGGPFPHYLNLLVLPWALFFMLVFCRWTEAIRPLLPSAVYLGVAVMLPAAIYLQDLPLPLRFPPTEIQARPIDAVRTLRVEGSPMIQWGWVYAYYVLTGTTWGTRTGGSHEIIEPFFPDKSIFIADYVAGLESGRAPVFLDTAMEGAPSYGSQKLFGHERVPAVAAAVQRHYFLCAVFPGARLFLSRSRYERRPDIEAWCAGLPHRRPPPPGPRPP